MALPKPAVAAGNGPRTACHGRSCPALVLDPGGSRARAAGSLACCRAWRYGVLDAGAIDAGLLRAWRRVRGRAPVVLTPHHGEMAGLLDCTQEEVEADPAALASAFAREWGLVLVLKAATTWIADGEGGLWVHRGGPSGLGTSGSGDVLAGLIGGLCARGATPAQAACWGVWLHARAGAALQRRHGGLGFLAREISAEVPLLMPPRVARGAQRGARRRSRGSISAAIGSGALRRAILPVLGSAAGPSGSRRPGGEPLSPPVGRPPGFAPFEERSAATGATRRGRLPR